MEIGFIGLGRMGKNMVFRLLRGGHRVVAWNRTQEKVKEVEAKGATGAKSIKELISKLKSKKIVWIMLPSGDVADSMIKNVSKYLGKGDILIDGGNSNFHHSMANAKLLGKKGINFLDIGVSGGIVGAEKGYAMMAGGERSVFKHVEPLIKSMCIKDGYGLFGPNGAGHYVKMIHNAIEYGIMQCIGEGFDLLANGRFKDLDLHKISKVWNNGTIISSFLMQMTEQALDTGLEELEPFVQDSGEGRWSVIESVEQGVPFTANAFALYSRFASRDKNSMAYKLLAAIRREFGGHSVKKK